MVGAMSLGPSAATTDSFDSFRRAGYTHSRTCVEPEMETAAGGDWHVDAPFMGEGQRCRGYSPYHDPDEKVQSPRELVVRQRPLQSLPLA